jgi:hypothetical protein
MKKTTLILFCLTLARAIAQAATYHLVETQILDGPSDDKRPPTAYVLLFPDQTRPKVFQKFDSKEMEAWLSGLPSGSVVNYDANGFFPPVVPAQLKALKTACEKKGVRFVQSAVN